jgi:DNA-directed RNA polymerase subunit RPC12/RpoP
VNWTSDRSRYSRGWAWCSREQRWVTPEEADKLHGRPRCPSCGQRLRVKPRNVGGRQATYKISDPTVAAAVKRIQYTRRISRWTL